MMRMKLKLLLGLSGKNFELARLDVEMKLEHVAKAYATLWFDTAGNNGELALEILQKNFLQIVTSMLRRNRKLQNSTVQECKKKQNLRTLRGHLKLLILKIILIFGILLTRRDIYILVVTEAMRNGLLTGIFLNQRVKGKIGRGWDRVNHKKQ